jgi:hypothetical protein
MVWLKNCWFGILTAITCPHLSISYRSSILSDWMCRSCIKEQIFHSFLFVCVFYHYIYNCQKSNFLGEGIHLACAPTWIYIHLIWDSNCLCMSPIHQVYVIHTSSICHPHIKYMSFIHQIYVVKYMSSIHKVYVVHMSSIC